MKIKECKAIVQKVLEDIPETRGSDNILIVEVLRFIDPSVIERPFKEVVPLCHINGRFPTFETIRRTRQKIQEQNPYLRPVDEIESKRAYQEQKFFDFAISRRN